MFAVGEERIATILRKGKKKKRNRNLDGKVYSGQTTIDCTIFMLMEAYKEWQGQASQREISGLIKGKDSSCSSKYGCQRALHIF